MAKKPVDATHTVGLKDDKDKLRFDLVNPRFEADLAAAMTHGAAKYGERNWEKGILITRLYAASRRHVLAYITGETNDPDTGIPHLAHATACNMMMYGLTGESRWDDRGNI